MIPYYAFANRGESEVQVSSNCDKREGVSNALRI